METRDGTTGLCSAQSELCVVHRGTMTHGCEGLKIDVRVAGAGTCTQRRCEVLSAGERGAEEVVSGVRG